MSIVTMQSTHGKPGSILLLAALLWLAALVPAPAEPAPPKTAAPSMAGFDLSKGPIRITADGLTASQQENLARFEGNVTATQDTTVIKANSLKIWYAPAPGAKKAKEQEQGSLPSTQTLEKIQASGNVIITTESFTSKSDEALYTQQDGSLVLTGDQAEVLSGKNKVRGTKITRSREGLLTFEGGVVAEFFPEESDKAEKVGDKEAKPAPKGD